VNTNLVVVDSTSNDCFVTSVSNFQDLTNSYHLYGHSLRFILVLNPNTLLEGEPIVFDSLHD
ncbi:unnamed protein product, partial [Rotaria sp. Silwood2]